MSSSKEPAPAKTVPSSRGPRHTQAPAPFVLTYNGQQVFVAPPKNYARLQFAIRDHFPNIPDDHRVWYFTKDLPNRKGVLTKVSREIWASTIPTLNNLIVRSQVARVSSRTTRKRSIKEEDALESPSDNESKRPPQKKPRHDTLSQSALYVPSRPNGKGLTLTLNYMSGSEEQLTGLSPSTTIRNVTSWIQSNKGFCQFRMVWCGKELDISSHDSLASVGIQDGSKLYVILRLRGGKPVIYLFPPSGSAIDASVKLSLVPEWHFSGIYPVVPITSSSSGGQSLKWDVKASPDGTLLEKNTGLEVAYLFWEAEALALSTKTSLTSDPSTEHVSMGETFVPNHPQLSPRNAVVVQVSKITPYIDSALKALGLHVEARTSFITYWLPSLLKHTHVALRFLPQPAYEKAAPLEVEPKPDVVIRVFMLFKGLKNGDLLPGGEWQAALNAGEVEWASVVGVDENRKLNDTTLFRVIEWGGMEALS